MASRNCKGRHLEWAICHSEQLADLSDPWAKLLFTWLIPNADNCGRLEGEPYQVAGIVFPLEMEKGAVTVAKVEKWLADLHERALIIWYRSGRIRYIQLPKFANHQTLSGNMKAVSDYPAPGEADIQAWEALEVAVRTSYGHCTDDVCTEAKDKAKDKASLSSDARTVFEYWQQQLGHPDAKFSEDRKGKIVARLKEGTSVERLCQAIDGCASSGYHMGENDQGRRYDSIELIFRNAGKVDEFIGLLVAKPGERPADLSARRSRVAKAKTELDAGGDRDVARNMVNDDLEWQEVIGGAR